MNNNITLETDATAYLAAIVESSDDAIISMDLNGIITSWNAAAERMYGYTAGETVGQSITLIIPPDHLEEEALILSRIRRGEKVDHLETIRRAKDGRMVEVSLTISPIRNCEGKVIGASKIARDITSRRAMERELQAKTRMLIERDRNKDDFLAMLAHELRNPLAPVSNTLQMLNAHVLKPEMQEEAVEMATLQITHMARLLDDLLDVSRIAHGKITLQHERIDVCRLLKDAVASADTFIKERNHTLQVHIPHCPIWMYGDATRIVQLFSNLLNNAAKYTPHGGAIALTVEETGSEAVIRIMDNGIGIEAEKLPYIFDMFMQVDNSMQRIYSGLGIGLTLVRKIAEMHGGYVEAYSKGKDKGTEFTVRLPLLKESRNEASPETDASLPPVSSIPHRALVVDDNEASAKTLGWMLEALGHEVKLAYSAIDALQKAPALKPDIILLDIGLPDISGYELCRKMRKDSRLRDTTFIAQTGWGQPEHMKRSRESGFDFHLVKPVSMEALQQLMENIGERAL